jgi:hypothetical protein
VFESLRLFRKSSKTVCGEEAPMAPSPSSVHRFKDMDEKTIQIDELIGDIVPMLNELDEKGLRDIKADLQVKITAARHALAKESTKVYFKDGKFMTDKP